MCPTFYLLYIDFQWKNYMSVWNIILVEKSSAYPYPIFPFLLFAKTDRDEVFSKHAFSRKKAAVEIVYFWLYYFILVDYIISNGKNPMKCKVQPITGKILWTWTFIFFQALTNYVSLKFSNKFISETRRILYGGFSNEKVTFS